MTKKKPMSPDALTVKERTPRRRAPGAGGVRPHSGMKPLHATGAMCQRVTVRVPADDLAWAAGTHGGEEQEAAVGIRHCIRVAQQKGVTGPGLPLPEPVEIPFQLYLPREAYDWAKRVGSPHGISGGIRLAIAATRKAESE